MDFMEHKTVLFNKIRRIEPDIANKIIGYLLLRLTDEEMISLGMSTDAVIQEVIHNAKIDLSKEDFSLLKSVAVPFSPSINSPPAVSEFSPQFSPFSPVSCRSLSSPTGYHVPPTLESQIGSKRSSEFVPMSYQDSMAELQNQAQFLSLEDSIDSAELNSAGFPSDFFYSSDASFGNLSRGRRHFGLNENSLKICHYYNKGYCKHGSSCRYFHGQLSEHSPRTFDVMNDDHIFSPGSLERLESEIVDLLRSRKGNPVSIASLPMMYYERYRKVLQADGYLTESQRHGKAGFSLTKLLAKLKNSIRLIDRPHGQHSVILVEDVPRYLENRGDRSDPGPIVSGSRQIYLTFPAESTFTEDDVSNYFSTFGQVEDVRIPCQQKRMFGFVTFESSDTVKTILAKGNPHFVCNARVLVKPYREKSKLIDRKFHERIESSMYFSPHYVDMDSELHSVPRGYESSRLLRKQLLEEQEQYELERRQRLAELRMRKTMPHQSYFGYSLEGLKVPEDNLPFSSSDGFNDLFDFLTNSSANEDKITHVKTSYTDQDSQGLNLPESPFASAIAST